MFVKVAFVVGEADRLMLPAASLVERGEVTATYVVDAAGKTSMRQVRVGHRLGDSVEVLAGVNAGERVAIDPIAAMQRLSHPAAESGS